MKKKWLIPLLCLFFVLPVCIAGAQEAEAEEAVQTKKSEQSEKTAQPEKAAPAKSKDVGTSIEGQARQAKNTVSGWIKKAVAFVSQIGGIFGSTLGFRIGGTTGTAIASLAVAKLAEDRIPPWLKWVLYLFGGSMAAGSGGNITQLIMSSL